MKTSFAVAIGIGLTAAIEPFGGTGATPVWVERLGWILFHSVWQLTAVALLAALVDWLLRRRSANVRYVALVVSLGLVIASPFVTWRLVDVPQRADETTSDLASEPLGRTNENSSRTIVAPKPAALAFQGEPPDTLKQDHGAFEPDGQQPWSAEPPLPGDVSLSSNRESAETLFVEIHSAVEPKLPFFVLLWFAGVVLCATRPIWGLWTEWRLRRVELSSVPHSVERMMLDLARRLGLRQSIRVAESARVCVPMAVGYLRPMVLLPACVVTGLTPMQLEALLAHELAHIRRHDWLVNAIQVIVETLLFYHPAVWWLSRRTRQEREHCCDDLALSVIGDSATYGRMLLALEELRQGIPQTALAANGGALLQRVRRVLAKGAYTQPVARGWLTGAVLLGLVGLVSGVWAMSGSAAGEAVEHKTDNAAKTDPDRAETAATAAATTPQDMKSLIAKVRENEDLFRNLDATIKTLWVFRVEKENRQIAPGLSEGPSVLQSIGQTYRMVTQNDRFFFSGEDDVGLTSGEKLSGKQTIVFDGTQTVAIAEGNSATVFRGRHEAARMVPPHCWGLFTLEVNFPLSVYLQGGEALKAHPKVRRYPVERGTAFEFNKVESEFIGEENVENLACIKVKVHRWYYTKDAPTIQYLWLAKDRNYHVAQCRTAHLRKGKYVFGDGARVTKWQEVASGIWLPAAVESQSSPPAAETSRALHSTRSLSVERAALNPALPADFFKLPEIPDSLPKFVIGRDGRLEDSPQHVEPAQADAGTTLDSILQRLAKEEAKYDRFEVNTVARYERLSRSGMISGGIHTASETRERSIFAGERLFYLEEKGVKLASGDMTSTVQRQAYDGRWTRGIYEYRSGTDPSKVQRNASLALGGPETMQVVRAHTMVFRGDRNRQSVSQFLKSGWFDFHNKYKMAVEYVGDEEVGGLHCFKLKCDMLIGEKSSLDNYFFIWLARDRNLIPIRHEWREPGWSDKLPTGINFVDDLREIRPGLWFPYRTTHLAFQKSSREGLVANRPLLQWRQEFRVDSLTLNPVVDDTLFTRVEVPGETRVSVRDERGEYIGQFKQPQAGNLNIAPEQLLELRQKAKVRKDETDRRQQALDAMIGRPAPELPRKTWLNSQPLTWKELAGKVVLIDFWAIWCAPCEADLNRLAELHKVWQDNGVTNRVLLGIHTAGSDRDKVAKTVADKKLGYPIVIDSPPKKGRAAWGALFDEFAIHKIPITIVVDGSGKIAAHGRLEEMLSKAAQLADDKQSKQ